MNDFKDIFKSTDIKIILCSMLICCLLGISENVKAVAAVGSHGANENPFVSEDHTGNENDEKNENQGENEKTEADKNITSLLTAKDYEQYSNAVVEWGVSMKSDHSKPGGTVPQGVSLRDYGAYYVGNTKEKVMYLTFDCGYEAGYTKKILKILKKHDIKAIFFVTESYIKSNVKIVKQMKKQGHLVGNHTCTHPRLTSCSFKKLKREVKRCAKTMKELTGYTMDQFIRPPEGVYSVRALKILQDMGYKTILWSMAYYDYDTSKQPGKQYVIDKFQTYYHKGAIPLLHAVSKSNMEALDEVIQFMQSKKYRFASLDELPERKQKT